MAKGLYRYVGQRRLLSWRGQDGFLQLIKLACGHRAVRTEHWAELGGVVIVLFHWWAQNRGAVTGNWPEALIDQGH